MSTPILLVEAICREVESALNDNVSQPDITVHEGFLPEKTSNNLNSLDLPYVIVRPVEGEEEDDHRSVTVHLIFGTKADDPAGFKDVLNVMERVRLHFLKTRTIENQFRLEWPYKWKLYDDQPQPGWIGLAVTTWEFATNTEEVEL